MSELSRRGLARRRARIRRRRAGLLPRLALVLGPLAAVVVVVLERATG